MNMHIYSDPDFQRAYVHALWDTLAAYGWENFSSAGRGLIYLHSFYAFPDGRVASQTEYVPAFKVTGEDLARLVDSYDPVGEIVVLFGLTDGSGMPYTFAPAAGQRSPFEAFKMKGTGSKA